MSMHKSLAARKALIRRRNVLTRWERLQVLRERGRWQEGQSVFGLPLTRIRFRVRRAVRRGPEGEGQSEGGGS